MKEQRRVYEALAQARKEELSSEKVELNLVQDLKRLKSEAQALRQKSSKNAQEIASLSSSARRLINELKESDKLVSKLEGEAESVWKQFVSNGRDMGIDPKDTVGFRQYNDILSDLLQVPSSKEAINALKTAI